MTGTLSTAPSGGVPAAVRKRQAEDDGEEDAHNEFVSGTLQDRHDRLIARYGAGIIDALRSLGHPVTDPDWQPPAELEAEGEGGGESGSVGATDSAVKLALDRESVRAKDVEGRLRVGRTPITKEDVNPYYGHEIPFADQLGLEPNTIYQLYRPGIEIAKGAASSNGIQLLKKHIPVSAEDHKANDVVGAIGTDAEFEAPYLFNSLSVWTQDAIDEIESDKKKELSCGYHYRPEMTPGIFNGKRYDGVMRDIVFNHVALVKDGRAGPDVVVGDSMENFQMSKPTRLANVLLQLTARAVKPILAKDAQIDLMPVFKDVTSKNFSSKKITLALDAALKGKLAKDATMEHVTNMLDHLEPLATEKGADESVSEEQAKQMAAAAAGTSAFGIPPVVDADPKDDDDEDDKPKAFDAEPFKSFLKEKGVSDADIKAACDMLPKGADAEPDDDEKKKAEAAAKAKEAEDAKTALAAKDAEMKDMVKKPAMDAAIADAVKQTEQRVRANFQDIEAAKEDVRPYIGALAPSMAFDSGEQVYRKALDMLGFDHKAIKEPAALKAILKLQPKPGESPRGGGEVIAMDAASLDGFAKMFPGADRITSA